MWRRGQKRRKNLNKETVSSEHNQAAAQVNSVIETVCTSAVQVPGRPNPSMDGRGKHESPLLAEELFVGN